MLMTVSGLHWDPRVLDKSHLSAHMMLVSGLLDLPWNSCIQEQLALGVRCMADLLVQWAQKLVEVRAPRRRSTLVRPGLVACEGTAFGGSLLEVCAAAQALLLRSAYLYHMRVCTGLLQNFRLHSDLAEKHKLGCGSLPVALQLLSRSCHSYMLLYRRPHRDAINCAALACSSPLALGPLALFSGHSSAAS